MQKIKVIKGFYLMGYSRALIFCLFYKFSVKMFSSADFEPGNEGSANCTKPMSTTQSFKDDFQSKCKFHIFIEWSEVFIPSEHLKTVREYSITF